MSESRLEAGMAGSYSLLTHEDHKQWKSLHDTAFATHAQLFVSDNAAWLNYTNA